MQPNGANKNMVDHAIFSNEGPNLSSPAETKIPSVIPKKYRLKENKIAIELNGIILPKDHYKSKKVKNNDKIEIVQFIGGG